MASAFTHAAIAIAIGKLAPIRSTPSKFWWLSILCAILPDADVLSFSLGIPYSDPFGHRGLTHSLMFALGLSLVITHIWFRSVERGSKAWWVLVVHFFLVTASHGVLDAMTDGGLGVAFFAPFDNSRYFLPWRPVMVSPIGVQPFFSRYGLEVMMSEFIWIWVPLIVVLVSTTLIRRL